MPERLPVIDLHMHSRFSDGTLTPTELVAQGCRIGLAAMALTDHDTTAGITEFLTAIRAAQPALRGFSGVEISVEVESGTLHLLGYGINPNHSGLAADLAHIRDGRAWRNTQILEKLQQLGIPLEWSEVTRHAGDEVVSRPHFAMALIERGVVTSKQAAFDQFLAKGQPAYVDRFRLTPAQGMARIREAGGIPVLAHPMLFTKDFDALQRHLRTWVPQGLMGIEAYYPEHTPAQNARLRRLAQEFGLLVTGGADFHGAMNPDVRMGVGFGGLHTPETLIAPLCKALPESDWVA